MAQLTLSDYRNNLFSNHFLEERIQEMKQWEETDIENRYKAFLKHYEEKKDVLEDKPKEGRTWSNFTRDVFRKILGHRDPDPQDEPSDIISGDEYNPDYTLFSSKKKFSDARKENNEFDKCYAIVEHKRWETKFGKSTQDHRNPEYQIYDYVNTLRIPWGILTDGRKWRLYSYEKCDKKIFFEIDLKDSVILEQDEEKAKRNFKLFYLLFRQQAFTPKGEGFADKVLEGTIKYNKQLKDNLKKDVYSAVETACKGFFEFTEQEATEENRKLVHDSALTLMYRLLFIMNAESRGLLPVENQTYHENYSIQYLQELIVQKEDPQNFFSYNTVAWSRLEKLFKAINSGDPLDQNTEIPPYNGGMFEHPDENEKVDPENKFLAENSIPGTFLKEVIKRLGTAEEDGKLKTLDYRDLDIRHLGSIYEGLLENKLQPPAEENLVLKEGEWKEADPQEFENADEEKRVEEGEVYLANDSGERKETGSYFTPDYIVEYIVENTIGPKIEEKVQNFKEEDPEQDKLIKILDLNVCDPAMGSGHFLTEATNYIADALLDHVRLEELDIKDEDETNWAKRQVVQKCIYGVDINPLATELAKVSLWIETMAEGKPLNFLDHHLKVGNSLIGSDFNELLSHPEAEEQKKFTAERDRTFNWGNPEKFKEKMVEKYQEIEEMPESSIGEIKDKEDEYRQFMQENDLYVQFKELANMHTHQYFEDEISPDEYDELVLPAIGDNNPLYRSDDFQGYQSAQEDAKVQNRNYFHWQLEFPKVFFGEKNGFDAVVGNPPYVKWKTFKDGDLSLLKKGNYRGLDYECRPNHGDSQPNIHLFFQKLSYDLTAEDSSFTFILPQEWTERPKAQDFRDFLLRRCENSLILFEEELRVFQGSNETVGTNSMIIKSRKSNHTDDVEAYFVNTEDVDEAENVLTQEGEIIQSPLVEKHSRKSENLLGEKWVFDEILDLLVNLEKKSEKRLDHDDFLVGGGFQPPTDLMDYFSITEDEYKSLSSKDKEYVYPVIKSSKNLNKFQKVHNEGYWIILNDFDSFEEIKNSLDLVYEYLLPHKEELKEDKEDWWKFPRIRNLDDISNLESKLLTPRTSKYNSFSLDKDKTVFKGTNSYVSHRNTELNERLLSYLNSNLLNCWYSYRGSDYHGSNRYEPGKVKKIPVKNLENLPKELGEKAVQITNKKESLTEEKNSFLEWVEAEWGVDIDDLSSLKTHLRKYWKYDFDSTGTTPSFMRVARKNQSQINGDVKSREFRELMKEEWESSMETLRPLMQKIDEMENEIDAIVFDLYDLEEGEVRKVLDSLNIGDDQQRSILNKFEEVSS